MSLTAIISPERAVIGMVHLCALPGTPPGAGAITALTGAALADARGLADGGVDALLVENFGDVPSTAGRVDAATVAAMSVVIGEIARLTALPFGVNVLRSDALSALA